MERLDSHLSPQEGPPERDIEQDFATLNRIAEVLRDMGFKTMDHLIKIETLQDPTAPMGFPIVRDGAQGIRLSYRKDQGFSVWFTNGFEDPKNEKVIAVKSRLKEEGLV